MGEVGERLDWRPVERPGRVTLGGSHVVVRPVDPARDADPLYEASRDPSIWTYLPDGPYRDAEHLRGMLTWAEGSEDPLYFTLVRAADERALGIASYLRIEPQHGTIEIGHIWFG